MEPETIAEKMKAVVLTHPEVMYQTHTWNNEVLNTGIRGIERRRYIRISDLRYKTLLDLGCATGAECIWALEAGAERVTGIDAGTAQVNTFKKIIDCLDETKNTKASAFVFDLKNTLPSCLPQYDTAFCFSITHHINYRKIWHEIPGVQVVYVEGGADSNYTVENLSDEVFDAEFISFIENNADNTQHTRPLFRLTRKAQKNVWTEIQAFTADTSLATDADTGNRSIIKPIEDIYSDVINIAANEYISYKLMMLLNDKGADIKVAKVELQKAENNNLGKNLAIIEYLGEHARINESMEYNYTFPDWLYWFDKWIGRIDSAGDTNLLLVNDKVIPVDFSTAYHWACGADDNCLKIDNFDIKFNPNIIAAKSDKVKKMIKSITDEELQCILLNNELDNFIPKTTRKAYYTGLCFRRDNLK